jgi:cell division protein ZapA
MAEVTLDIAGRQYQVACRDGEEENLRAAARLVDGKSREALAGLGTLSETRQFLFASLLLADQMLEDPNAGEPAGAGGDDLVPRVERLAERLESLATALEARAATA